MVRVAGGAGGTNLCQASAIACHTSFPSPPRYVGKRDVTLMVKNFNTGNVAYGLAQFDFNQANDDRTNTYTAAVTSRAVRTGRRLWVQGYDASYSPSSGTDRARVVLVSRPNGPVTSAAGADERDDPELRHRGEHRARPHNHAARSRSNFRTCLARGHP